MASNYVIGQLVRIQGEFTDELGDFIDPATITLTVEVNDSTGDTVVTTTGLTHPSTGTYTYDYDVASTGLHEYRWISVNPQTAGQSWFTVDRSRIVAP